MHEIMNKIDLTVDKYNMLSYGDTVVIGVSGGADSMLLLEYFIQVKEKFNLNLIVANVEHGIRGEESKRDTLFVRDYCEKHDIEFKSISVNAVKEAENQGKSVEEVSRKIRYDFFASLNPDKIATAHNLSDNVETVLFRLSRGTSIKGCCGIPPVRENIIRPLLNCTSEEIRTACKHLNIEYMIDSTNSDFQYSRNYIRGQIITDFESLNPSFERVMNRFINSVNEDNEYLEKTAQDCFELCYVDNTLDVDKLNSYHISIIKRVIVKYLEMNNLSVDEIHLSGIVDLLNKQGKYQIKNDYFAICSNKRLRIAKFVENIDFSKITLKKRIVASADFLINCELLAKEFDFYCDCDKISGNVSVRSREEGDTISPANRNCSKSLKKSFNEHKVNIEQRPNIPVFIDDLGIIGVKGICCDERVKTDNDTKNVLLIKVCNTMEDSF